MARLELENLLCAPHQMITAHGVVEETHPADFLVPHFGIPAHKPFVDWGGATETLNGILDGLVLQTDESKHVAITQVQSREVVLLFIEVWPGRFPPFGLSVHQTRSQLFIPDSFIHVCR